MNQFREKWALILGGSSGLGLATAKKLARHGINILIVHRDRKSDLVSFSSEIQQIENLGVQVKTLNKDALKEETIFEVIEMISDKSLKVLVHSIAKGTVKPMLATNGSELSVADISITANAMGFSWFQWVQSLIRTKKFTSDARSIAFTSEGNTKAWKYYGAVSVAKASLEALMRQMALEYAPLGLRTNCIQAGMTKTQSFSMIPGSEQIATHAISRNPFKRLTEAEDIANVVYLLCQNESKWINGTVIKVDGGESLH